MIEDIGGVTSQLVGVALDAALLRHELIANNIANANTPGFKTKHLAFEQYLADFSALLNQGDDSLVRDRIDSLKSAMENSESLVITRNESVELDREMVRLTENTLRYQALLDAAGKRGEIIKMAVQEGRRG